ncbi:MAG TPA: GNAT family protein [Verrucomicrobiae bacterium]|nr:GNAT family protein [Verrucomicrobiae bacterium]
MSGAACLAPEVRSLCAARDFGLTPRISGCAPALGRNGRVINLGSIIRGLLQGAYVGYYAFAPHAGKGLMREGLQLVLKHAFQKLRLHRLEANIQPGNQLSLRLARRCGFAREGFSRRYLKDGGRWRDHERWAILAEDLRRSSA